MLLPRSGSRLDGESATADFTDTHGDKQQDPRYLGECAACSQSVTRALGQDSETRRALKGNFLSARNVEVS